ncbi:MAG TPA: GNAT family N-acetyltransferase, partial [Candidatus Nanopelagicales bacterium]|nr:GNAT family N-acetyltransferase [Candidatus Nanopelagicales bacterium]
MTIALRPMTAAEFAAYHDRSVRGFAEQMHELGGQDLDSSFAESERQMGELLPDGLATEGQHLLVVEDDGVPVGTLWLGARRDRSDLWWVWELEIDEAHRGRGHGRAAMLAGEAYAR